jgi:ornithine decarboxylase
MTNDGQHHPATRHHDDGLETPFFVLDPDAIRERVRAFREAFPGVGIYYAMKANSEAAVLQTVNEMNCGFEAASWFEIRLLLDHGVAPEQIIYGTAVKPRCHVENAVAAGISLFAADSVEELTMLGTLAPGARVMIRARADDSRSVYQLNNKFGAAPDQMVDLVRRAIKEGLVPWGVSFHVGSQATDHHAWAAAIRSLRPAMDDLTEEGIALEVLNLGGGFPSTYANHLQVPQLAEIAATMRGALDDWPYRPRLIVEPGRALVANAMTLVTTVVSRIERGGGSWLYLDGGVYNALFESMIDQGRILHSVHLVGSETSAQDQTPYTLAGPTGDGIDVIAHGVRLPHNTEVGDRLAFEHVGAYSIVFASTFNGFPRPMVRIASTDAEGAWPGIDTFESRRAIGFPRTNREWCQSPAIYDGNSLRIAGHPVMEDWEQSYMATLGSIVAVAGGNILELGYGMGLSAKAIQSHDIASHVVVECHPDVIKRASMDCESEIASGRLHLYSGFWQDVTPTLASGIFDGILFDTYPLREEEIHGNHLWFFAEAYRLLKPNGVLTYYSDEVDHLSPSHIQKLVDAGFRKHNIEFMICDVRPPADCEYWQHNTLVAPVVRKHTGSLG